MLFLSCTSGFILRMWTECSRPLRDALPNHVQLGLDEPQNAWKVDYNRALSGLHTSISAHITKHMDLSPEDALKEYKR